MTKAATIMYERHSFSVSRATMFIRTSTTTTTGTSNVTPNARKVDITNDRYFSISVIQATPSGAMFAMNLNTVGNTRKYAKDMPTKNNTTLAATSGKASRFSCEYKPGATKAQT